MLREVLAKVLRMLTIRLADKVERRITEARAAVRARLLTVSVLLQIPVAVAVAVAGTLQSLALVVVVLEVISSL
jgi:hypothetical protein